ncbi:conserved protein of unknown function [Ruminococcaceae bacterium BL-6]|jgi:hypothetical protein|nr:conserved protein of unknown function [Ruminococcaceae bacterium BL-6]HBN80854.1 hypothetical protein [Oscillospiraceae bacterium]
MEKIVIEKKLLERKLAQSEQGRFIELCIVPAQTDCGENNPAFLHIASIHNNGFYEDMETIDECLPELVIPKTA